MLALTFLKLTDEAYLAMVSVQVPQLADIAQGDPLRQRLRTHVRRGKGRQAVRRICKKKTYMLVTIKGMEETGSKREAEANWLQLIPMYC